MAFDDWVNGTYSFYGVCHNEFKLNDQVWEAMKDPGDGYRSYLDSVERVDSTGIFFDRPLARVKLLHLVNNGNNRDVYVLLDVDGHAWLEFGTDNTDDYYPYFVFEYHPKEALQMEERLEQNIDELFGQPVDVAVGEGPTVQVVLPNGTRTPLIPFADLQRDGADPATASDAEVIRLIANHLDRDIGEFGGYQVTRPDVGRIVVMSKPAYGLPHGLQEAQYKQQTIKLLRNMCRHLNIIGSLCCLTLVILCILAARRLLRYGEGS